MVGFHTAFTTWNTSPAQLEMGLDDMLGLWKILIIYHILVDTLRLLAPLGRTRGAPDMAHGTACIIDYWLHSGRLVGLQISSGLLQHRMDGGAAMVSQKTIMYLSQTCPPAPVIQEVSNSGTRKIKTAT